MLLGMDAILYILTTGTRATWGAVNSDGLHEGVAPANLTEFKDVKDLAVAGDKAKWDSTTRGNNGYRSENGTLKNGTVTFQIIYNPANALVIKLLKSWTLNTPVACAVLDGDKATVGTIGYWADYEVFTFGKSENLEEGQLVDIEMGPTYSAVGPEVVKVIAGA